MDTVDGGEPEVVDVDGKVREVVDAEFLKGLGCSSEAKNVFGVSAGMPAADRDWG